MSTSKLKSIWSRYSVTIVMVPSLIGLHYGWNVMQNNRSLVSADEQIDLPPVTFAKYVWRELVGKSNVTNAANNPNAATETSSKPTK